MQFEALQDSAERFLGWEQEGKKRSLQGHGGQREIIGQVLFILAQSF